jgi:hypothetical protein
MFDPSDMFHASAIIHLVGQMAGEHLQLGQLLSGLTAIALSTARH